MLEEPQKILLTGGTSGIGLALLQQLHEQGHRLVVLARNPDKLAGLAIDYPGIDTHVCDLSQREAIEAVVPVVLAAHPDLNILINNAGTQYESRFTDSDFSPDTIGHETATNFLGPVWLIAALLPHLQRVGKPAAIVNVSSGLAIYPKTGSAIYCATKAALHSFSQSLRYQLEGSDVRVFEAIVPMVDTPMTAGRGSGKISPEECARQMLGGIRQGREEIYIGKTRLLPILSRLAPGLARKILKNTG